MASTTNSPVEGTSETVEETPDRAATRTRLFRPGAHAREAAAPVDEPVVGDADSRAADLREAAPATADPVVQSTEPEVVEERRVVIRRAHTSPAATFSLIVGVAALYTALLVFLTPFDVVLGVVAVLLGLFGMRAARKVGVTGRGVAALGTLLGLAAILLGTLTLTGVQTGLNDKGAVDRIQQQVDHWRNRVADANLSDPITN